MNKKIMANALAVTMLFTSASGFAQKSSDVSGTRFENAVKKLSAFGIMSGDGDGSYRPNDSIKRSEVARMAVHLLGLEDAAKAAEGETKFPDVSAEHWASGYINVAATQNIIVGDDTGMFRPNDSITYAEVMVIFVKALGYGAAAEQKGGFPQGYLTVGSDNGLNKGVTVSAREAVSRGEIALITESSLEVNMMDITGYGGDLKYEVTDKTILKDKLKITKGEGQITAIDSTSLDGASSLADGQVEINKKVYDTSTSFNELLGYNVEYYLKDTDKGDDTLILAMPKNGKNTSVSINAKLFEGVSEKNGVKLLEYYKSENDEKTTTVSLDTDAKLIYNGKHEAMNDELLSMENKSGSVNVLDTDKNGKYDVVFVTEYRNIVVDDVSKNGKISDKYGAEPIKLDEEDSELSFTIKKGFEEIKPSELKEYDILSVAISKDKKLILGVVTNEIVTGKIAGMHKDGVYIDNKLYEIAANYKEALTMGTEGVFYLDIDGRIAASDTKIGAGGGYAYLIKAYADMNTDERTYFKLFTADGKELTLEAAEKIRYNGVSGKKATDVIRELNKNGEKQLVTYTLNKDGKLNAVDTALDNTETGKVNESKFTLNYKLTNVKYNEKLKRFGNIKIDDDTVIFDIPSTASDSTDYSILNPYSFTDGQTYDLLVFDRTDDFYAKALIVTNASSQANSEESVAIVSKIISASNANDDIVSRLYVYRDGKEITVDAENNFVLTKSNGKMLENGDIIQYKTNAKGNVTKVNVLFDVNNKAAEKEEKISEKLAVIYGKVTKKFSNSINVSVNGDNIRNIQLPQDITVYTLDTSKSKNNIKNGSLGDIHVSDEDERVFIKIYDDVVREVIVIS